MRDSSEKEAGMQDQGPPSRPCWPCMRQLLKSTVTCKVWHPVFCNTQLTPAYGTGLNPRGDTICDVSLSLVLALALRGFSLGTPVYPCPQKPTFPLFRVDLEWPVDEEPLSRCSRPLLGLCLAITIVSVNSLIIIFNKKKKKTLMHRLTKLTSDFQVRQVTQKVTFEDAGIALQATVQNMRRCMRNKILRFANVK